MDHFSCLYSKFQYNLMRNFKAMTSISYQQSPNNKNEKAKHAPAVLTVIQQAGRQLCDVKAVDLKISSSDTVKTVSAFLHMPRNHRREQTEGREKTAAILLSGAGGGVAGPSSIYLSIADKLASLNHGIPVMRLDFRYPARNKYCVPDVLKAMDYLQNGYAVTRFVLVGWSFGGAPVFTVGAQDTRVVACATIASQTVEADGVMQVARKALPVLLLHGTADRN